MIHSPFPGMDPYLEAPTIWPDVHTRLMSIIGEQLTPLLAPKYLAELETQVVIDRIEDDPQVVLPDVSVTNLDVSIGAPSAVAVAAPAPVNVWPIHVRQPLPTIPIPLLAPDPPVPLDLGQALRTAYERARYDLRVDYHKPPIPPLSPADAVWAAALIGTPGRSAPLPG